MEILQPRILEWVAMPSSSRSSQPRDWTQVCHIAGGFFTIWATAAAKSFQLCPIDGSPPGSPVPGILQAGTLEWVVISFSNAWKWKVKVKSFSHARLFATPWTAAYQAPPPMGFSRQEYWSGLPLPSPLSFLYMYKIDVYYINHKHLSLSRLTNVLCSAWNLNQVLDFFIKRISCTW